MKHVASILLLISFVGMTVFGLALFEMAPNHQGGCISAIDAAICPANIIGFATHHIAAVQALTSAVLTPTSVASLLLVALFIVGVAVLLFIKNWRFPALTVPKARQKDLELSRTLSKSTFVSWLSLFELSPAL